VRVRKSADYKDKDQWTHAALTLSTPSPGARWSVSVTLHGVDESDVTAGNASRLGNRVRKQIKQQVRSSMSYYNSYRSVQSELDSSETPTTGHREVKNYARLMFLQLLRFLIAS
jgi:hypothetical protein